MKDLLRRLNDLPVFDLAAYRQRERLARGIGVVACAAYLAYRVWRFPFFREAAPPLSAPLRAAWAGRIPWSAVELGLSDWDFLLGVVLWLLETGVFAGYLLAYLTRREARSVARGFREVVFPLIVAGLPFVITFSPVDFLDVWPPTLERLRAFLDSLDSDGLRRVALLCRWETALLFFLSLIVLGSAWNLVGLLTLRPAFTLTSEARVFVRRGIYRLVRHPIYTGHFVIFFGYLMFHLHWYTTLVYVAFVMGQSTRARIEESKLERVFPEYARYRESTGMFLPRFRRRHEGADVRER